MTSVYQWELVRSWLVGNATGSAVAQPGIHDRRYSAEFNIEEGDDGALTMAVSSRDEEAQFPL